MLTSDKIEFYNIISFDKASLMIFLVNKMPDEFNNMISDPKKVKQAWKEFVRTGKVSQGLIRDEILKSWKRCKSYGLDPNIEKISSVLTEEEIKKLLAENRVLIDKTRLSLGGFSDWIKEQEVTFFLANRDCVLLDSFGEGATLEYGKSKVVIPGSCMEERCAGTNTCNLAIKLDQTYQMIGEEHYLKFHTPLTVASAPIHAENAEIIGVLTICANYKIPQKHPYTFLGMVRSWAKVIESQIRLQREFEKTFLANQYFNAASESMGTGLLIVNRDNIITHSNPAVEKILGISVVGMEEDRRIEDIINNKNILEAIYEKRTLSNHEVILGEGGKTLRCLVRLRPIFDSSGKVMGNALFLEELARVQRLFQKVVGFEAQYTFRDIWGKSPEIRRIIELAKHVAKSPSNVIVTGESGTGKEMLAQSIHNASLKSSGPFLGINCASIPHDLIESELFGYEAGTFTGGLREGRSGKLEMANGGTLFLDEINGMSLDMQVKLLRVLEEKKFFRLGGKNYLNLEARIIAATNRDLQQEIKQGSFRSDLYFRLSIFEINIPPLRDRKGDVKFLVLKFAEEISGKIGKKVEGISPEAMAYLENYQWPGNVRELKNWIERAVYLTEGSILALEDFSQDTSGKTSAEKTLPKAAGESSLKNLEMNTIELVLNECGGNISQASKRLGIGRKSLYRKLHKYNFGSSKIFFPRDN